MKMKTDAQSSSAQPGINSAIDIANITFELTCPDFSDRLNLG